MRLITTMGWVMFMIPSTQKRYGKLNRLLLVHLRNVFHIITPSLCTYLYTLDTIELVISLGPAPKILCTFKKI